MVLPKKKQLIDTPISIPYILITKALVFKTLTDLSAKKRFKSRISNIGSYKSNKPYLSILYILIFKALIIFQIFKRKCKCINAHCR